MNPISNPFAPGAGTRPPEMAGREKILTDAEIALGRVKIGRPADKRFFRVRIDRLTTREKDYMRTMADLGVDPHRSGDIAQRLGIDVTAAGPLRNGLIKKGMIFSPQHGETAFTVPMFDEFMRGSMPDWAADGQPRNEPRRAGKRRGKS